MTAVKFRTEIKKTQHVLIYDKISNKVIGEIKLDADADAELRGSLRLFYDAAEHYGKVSSTVALHSGCTRLRSCLEPDCAESFIYIYIYIYFLLLLVPTTELMGGTRN
jgi:hypothetical protein